MFDVLNLTQVDNLGLLEGLQRDGLSVNQRQVDLAEGAGSNDADQLEVGDLAVRVFDGPSLRQ